MALRHLLTAYLWQSFLFLVVRPLQWLYVRVLQPSVLGVVAFFKRHWLRLVAVLAKRTEPSRILLRRRLLSRWRVFVARWRVLRRRPKVPTTALTAPPVPHEGRRVVHTFRLTTAIGAVALIALVAALSMRDPQVANTAVADDRPSESPTPITIILTPTPLPPTPTPIPTVPVKLTPWGTPNPLEGGGAGIFTQHVAGNSDIVILPVDQVEPIRLTTHPAEDKDPAWSPDGLDQLYKNWNEDFWRMETGVIPF